MKREATRWGYGYLAAPALLLTCGAASYPTRLLLPIAVRGTFADAIWAAAFAYVLAALTLRNRPWLLLGMAVALGLELAQRCPYFPGTFDRADLVAIGLGYTLGLVLERTLGPRGGHRNR